MLSKKNLKIEKKKLISKTPWLGRKKIPRLKRKKSVLKFSHLLARRFFQLIKTKATRRFFWPRTYDKKDRLTLNQEAKAAEAAQVAKINRSQNKYLINSLWSTRGRFKKSSKKKFKKCLWLEDELVPSDYDGINSLKPLVNLEITQLKRNQLERQRREMRSLRQRYKEKLSDFFFQPWKKVLVRPTKKQHWLKTTYGRYQTLYRKDRNDFFRTFLGRIIGNLYWNNWNKIRLTKKYFEYYNAHKTGWWYDNLVQKKKTPRSAKRFVLDRPRTAFQIHWTQQKLEPWKDSLLFKRAMYSGFHEDYRKENRFQVLKIKPYLRSKNPRQEKRTRLYSRAHYLLKNYRQRNRIRADKFARIKQLTNKILSPFYGRLRLHQIKRLVTKSKKKKSQTLTCNEVILSHFENRLDVTIYRMNLAPSILWARRLIKAGLVFVASAHKCLLWEGMYGGLKKLTFPLKLRDPKTLYAKTYWRSKQQNWLEFKFLGQPNKKISYLLQAGDLIQCAPGAFLNHFKTRPSLCQKPIPKHLLIKNRRTYEWHFYQNKFRPQTFKNWAQNTESIQEAIFLHASQFRDFDSKDRLKESFFRWAMI